MKRATISLRVVAVGSSSCVRGRGRGRGRGRVRGRG